MSALPFSTPARPTRPALLAVALLVVVLVASAMRLINLGKLSLWEDELFSADLVLQRPLVPPSGVPWLDDVTLHALQLNGPESFWTVKAADQSPPMFELAAKLSTSLLGPGEAALRLPSALAAVAALIWLAWRAWRARGSPLQPAYLTVLVLTAFSGLMIFYAREARGYGLGAALTTVLVVRFWERNVTGWRQARLPGWGEITLCVAACMTHYNALALVGLLLLPCAWQALHRRDWAALARMAVVAGFVALWITLSVKNFVGSAAGHMGWHHSLAADDVVDVLLGDYLRKVTGPWLTALFAAVLLAAVLWGPGRASGDEPAAGLRRATMASALLLVLTCLVAVLVARSSTIMNERHLIFATPVLFVLAGSCLALLALRWPRVVTTFLLLATAAQLPLAQAALKAPKSNFRAVTAYVTERLQPGDPIMFTPILNASAYNYYVSRSGKPFRTELMGQHAQARNVCDDLAPYPRVGMLGHGSHLELANAFKRACGERYNIDYIERFGTFGVVWTKK